MEEIIIRFISELRKKGIRVSPGEGLDAVQALELGGIRRRTLTRRLLRLTLVKNVNDVPVFNEVFNVFFSTTPPEAGLDLPALMDAAIGDLKEEDDCGGECEIRDQNFGPLLTLDDDDIPADLDELKSLQEADPDDGEPDLVVDLKGYRGKALAPRPSRLSEQEPLRLELDQSQQPQDEGAFSHEEQAEMREVVSRMLLRLRKDKRRMRSNLSRGKLHVTRTIRKNMRNDAVPFRVVLRRRHPEQPRLVVLCDVSYSVSFASRFMLLLLHTLQNQQLEVRSFVFNREIEEVTGLLANLPVNDLMQIIDSGAVVDVDANSSFGQVFVDFKNRFLDSLRGRPAVIILGDARNNYDQANDWVLEHIREKARYLLWLTPLERELWNRGDCLIDLYGAYCDRVEVVKTVDDLSLVVEDLLRNASADQTHPLDRCRIRSAQLAADHLDANGYYARDAKSGS